MFETFGSGNRSGGQPNKTYSRGPSGGIEILADYVLKYNSNFDYGDMSGYQFTDNALCHLIPETGTGFLLAGTTSGKGCDIDNMVGPNSTSFMPLGFIATGQGVWSFTEKQGEAGWDESYEDIATSYQHNIMPMLFSPSSNPDYAGDYNAPAHILFNQRDTDYTLNLYKDNRASGSSYPAEEGVLMEYQYFKILVPSDIDIDTVSLDLTNLVVTDANNTNQLLHIVTWADETGEEEDGLTDFNDFLDSDGILDKAQICSCVVSFDDISTNGANKVCKLNLALTESDTEQYNVLVGLRPSLLRSPELFVDADRSDVSGYDAQKKFGVYMTNDFTGFEYLDFLKEKLQNSQNNLSNDISVTFGDFEFYGDEVTSEEPIFFQDMGYYNVTRSNVIESAGTEFPVFIGPGDTRPGNMWQGYDIGAIQQYYYTFAGVYPYYHGILNPRMGMRTQSNSGSTYSWSTLSYENINDDFRGNCKYFSIIKVCSILKSDWSEDINLRLPQVAGIYSNDFEYFRRKTIDTATGTTKTEDGYVTDFTAFTDSGVGLYRLDSDDLPDLNSQGATVSTNGYGTDIASYDMDPTLYPASNLSSRWTDNWTKVETLTLADFGTAVTHDQPASTWDYSYPNLGNPTPLTGTTGETSNGTFTKPAISSEGLEITLSPSTGAGNGDYANFYLCFDAIEDIDTRATRPPTPSLPAGQSWDGGVPDYDHIYNKTNYIYFCSYGSRSCLSQKSQSNILTNNVMSNLSNIRSYSKSYLYYPAEFE